MKLPALIQLNIPFILIVLVSLIAGLISFWLYKRTNPELNSIPQIVLGSLRAILLLLVLLLIFKPQLTLKYHTPKKKTIAVFIDNSSSMRIRDSLLDRRKQLLKAVNFIRNNHSSGTKIVYRLFSSKVFSMKGDSIPRSTGSTNLYNVMQNIKQLHPDLAVILSDGYYTQGFSPLDIHREMATKIVTIGIGSRLKRPDLFIRNVKLPRLAYQNKKQEIEVQIGSENMNKETRALVQLSRHNKVMATKKIQIHPGEALTSVTLSYTPEKVGLQRIQVKLSVLAHERNKKNNRKILVQNVLKSKIAIAIFCGNLGYETKFLNFLLGQNTDFSVHLYVHDKNGRWFGSQKPFLSEIPDVFIFQNFPTRFTPRSVLKEMSRKIKKDKPGILLYLGQYTSLKQWPELMDILPVNPNSLHPINKHSTNFTPLEKDRKQGVTIFEDQMLDNRFWDKVPPVDQWFLLRNLKKKAKTLIYSQAGSEMNPFLIRYIRFPYRSYVVNGQGLWKWSFFLQDDPDISGGYLRLLNHIIRTLTLRQQIKALVLNTERKVYAEGEPVLVTAHLYDMAYKPIKDGTVLLQAEWQGQRTAIDVSNDSSGTYKGLFTPPQPGTYVIEAMGERRGAQLGKDKLQIEVVPFDKEFLHDDQNVALLKQLAEEHHGRYVSINGLDSLKSMLTMPATTRTIVRIYELWHELWLLIFIVLLVTTEWILRKKYGLI